MVTLKEIYEEQADFVERSGFTVEVDRAYSTVAIGNNATGECIFLQDHEADEWIKDVNRSWREVGNVRLDRLELAKAAPYVESLI